MNADTAGRSAVLQPRYLVDAAVLVAITLFLLGYLRPSLLLSRTTATGGDMASHFSTLQFLVTELLPRHRILGWMQGNLAGFPLFQLYFPLPFLLMAALSPFMPLQVAFKLGTVAGIFLLPVAAYLLLDRLGFRRPAPIFAAVLTLPFLMVESHSVWGGNLPSTLAGEFSYSLGLSLALVFLGVCHRSLARGRGVLASGVLLAAVSLAHIYALLLAGTVSAAFVLWTPDRRRAIGFLARVYLLAFALAAFWFLPLLGYAPYTSPYRDIWQVESWRQLLPPILWPAALVVVLAGLAAAVTHWRQGGLWQPISARLAVLLSLPWLALTLYWLVPIIGGVDIRFLPVLQLSVGLVAAVPLARLARSRPAAWLLPPLLAIATMFWVDSQVTYIPEWIEWNYSGFESRPLWPEFEAVNRFLKGDVTDPRVVFEHSPAHNAAGSIRAFESLPLFSGRSTLEGLYIQSGLLTPEIFYLQSEISEVASCPLPNYHCGRLDPPRAVEHLRQMNVSQVIARSDALKSLLADSPDYRLEATIGPYEIHRVAGVSGRYVEPLPYAPIVLDSDDWKRDFFKWFKRPGSSSVPLVKPLGDTPPAGSVFAGAPHGSLPDALPLQPLDTAGIVVREEIDQERIRIHTNRPGHPLLIRIAYHPRWQVHGAPEILLASPGFMLVVPDDEEIELVFGDPPWVDAAHLLTLLASLVVGVGLLRPLRRRPSPAARDAPTVSPAWLALPPLAAVVAMLLALALRTESAPLLYEHGLELYKQERNEAAANYFGRAMEAEPLSSAALHSSFYRSLCAFREQRWAEALGRFETMVERYPETIYRAESEYHIGLCRLRLERPNEAREAFSALIRSFPESPWAERARQQLENLE